MASGGWLVTSDSSMVTVPALMRTTPTRLLSRVLLPEPLAPTSDTTSPGSACTVTPRITGSPPYPATTPATRSTAPRDTRSADKVSLHNVAPGPQLGHRPLGQDRALRHGHHGVAELVHDGQFVLDHDHGQPLLGQRGELTADPPGEVRVDARHRLVEQEHPRLGHQCAHDLHQPALAAAEVPGVAV